MRDGRVDEEVAGLLDPTARSARRSTDTTYGVIKAITACLVLVSAAALVLVRLSHLPRSVTLSRVLFCARRARGPARPPRDGAPRTRRRRGATRERRHARAHPTALTAPFFPAPSLRVPPSSRTLATSCRLSRETNDLTSNDATDGVRFAAASPKNPRLSASLATSRTRARGARRRGSTTCSSPAARRSSGA